SVRATVQTNPNGTVSLSLSLNGQLLLSAMDAGTGGAPILAPGAVGIRASNDQFKFGPFTVSSLGAPSQPMSLAPGSAAVAAAADLSAPRVFPNPWRSDRHSGLGVTF